MNDLRELTELDRQRGDLFSAKMQAQSNREAGWTSIFVAIPLLVGGALLAKCTMEVTGTHGSWTDIRHDGIVAVTGLAWAAAGMIGVRKHWDVSPMNFLESRRQKKLAKRLGKQVAQTELALTDSEPQPQGYLQHIP